MKKSSLFALTTMVLLLIAVFMPVALSTGPTQPPVDTSTLYVGTIAWGPKRADPVRAYDTGSGELLFNVYDTLISMGSPVKYGITTFDVEEQYWAFEPSLSENVPEREEIIQDFLKTSFVETIYVRNHTAVPPDFMLHPVCTWWEDDMLPIPIDKYHIYSWIDSGPQNPGELGPSDWVYMNAYWWLPPQDDKECQWWHVKNVQFDVVRNLWILTLEKNTATPLPPTPPPVPPVPLPEPPVCQWYVTVPPDGILYHINGWVDNNPDGVLGPCDVLYIGEFENVTIEWFGQIIGWHLVPITKRTWHVLEVTTTTLHLHRFYYDFNIRTDPVIYFYDSAGVAVDTFDIYDAEYSLKRGLVQDQYGSPMWMYYKPLFDQMNSDYWDTGDPADAISLSYLIKDAVEIVSLNPPVLRINVGIAFPDAGFKQIMAQTWGSILSKEWCIGKGCWNGELFSDTNQDCYPNWWTQWRHISLSPIQPISTANYAGTGPYRVVVASAAQLLVVLQRNPDYWKGWPFCKGMLEFVDIEYMADWATRREAFKAGQLDVCAVPRAFIMELLDPLDLAKMRVYWGGVAHPEVITIKNIAPTLAMDAKFFCFTVEPTAAGLHGGVLPAGVPPNFFNYSGSRYAFSYAFDRAKYLHEVWLDEAICRETPDILGLVPDYYSLSPDPPWKFTKDKAQLVYWLQNTFMNATGGQTGLVQSLWAWGGFHVTIYYNAGNDPRRLACEFQKETFDEINAEYGTSFIVDVEGPDWATYLGMMEEFKMPEYVIGWLADFADADNWKRPYMHSYGDFSYYCNYTSWNGWAETIGPRTGLTKDFLIDLAVKTPDGPLREAMYKDLDDIYLLDDPNLPIVQALGRRWCKYWVKGWYYNALYPSQYYYKLYKEDACWADVTGPTLGVPDGVCNMRDIGYIAGRFGAKAPDPAKGLLAYDPKWAPGMYGQGGADVYGDRKVDMRDIGFACAHFGHANKP